MAVRPDFELDEANAAAVARICRALDGMPLAIELAAVWLRTLAPAQLAERLDDRFALLTGGSRTALPRHRTLRAVVNWSWDLLSASEQVLARRLAIFPGGATLAAAEHVCADELLPSAAVLPALSGLVDKSILTTVESPDGLGSRYRMLETVRAYGLERLAEAGEEAVVRDAFTAYYLNLAETADPELRAAGQRRWLRELASEQDNLHAALRLTITRQDADTALRLVRALGWYWMLRGQPGEPEVLARAVLALEPRERSPRMAEARVVCALTAAGETWDIDAERPVLAAAIADFARRSPNVAPTHPIAAMGEPMLALYDRDPERAFAVFDQYSRSEDPWVRAAAPLMRGTFGSVLGRTEWAESDCQAALTAFRALGEAWGTAAVLINMAEFAKLKGDYPAAIAALRKRHRSARSSARGQTCPTLPGSSPRSGCGQVIWRRPAPTWSGPSAAIPSGAPAAATRRSGSGWCEQNSTSARAIPPRPRACAPSSWPGWKASSRPGGTERGGSSRPGWPWPCWRTGIRTDAVSCSLMRFESPLTGWNFRRSPT